MVKTIPILLIVIAVLLVSFIYTLLHLLRVLYIDNKTDSTDVYNEESYPPANPSDNGEQNELENPESSNKNELWHDFRLSKFVLPEHYDLILKPNISGDVFKGQVNITVNLTRETDVLIVHKYHSLHVSESAVYSLPLYIKFEVETFEYKPNEFWVIQTSKTLKAGRQYMLHLAFGASLIQGLHGFYKSTYTNRKLNLSIPIVSSKFQPTFARRAFPCFDEPNWKSTYTVTLVHDPDMTALSNMPVENSTKNADGDQVTTFQKSVPMVTYLVCFVIGDYRYLEKISLQGTRFRVYATPDQLENAQYALDLGVQVLSYFEEYFGIPYPLPKQDMVAIPDFISGAMEHWGLITYRESSLLYNETNSSSHNKQKVSSVIAHELAHMWFGNLVTMWWWDDLWLNEGFATYFKYKGVIHYKPHWDMSAQFLTSGLQFVMELDSKKNSHPIIQAVHHPDQITELFDLISYSKGASVLRMMEMFMGSKDFRYGVQKFIKEHEYGNAETEDLWSKLSESSSKSYDISAIMRSWTTQKGFPIVNITRDSSVGFFASQQVYSEDGNANSSSNSTENSRLWQIPLTYVTSLSPDFKNLVWFNSTGPVKFQWMQKQDGWIKFNVDQAGYYLVNYESSDWSKLHNLLLTNHELLSVEDRSSLLHDAFKLASAGYLRYDVALKMTQYLVKEDHFVPWITVYYHFIEILEFLTTSDGYIYLQKYMLHLTSPLMKKLGWDDSGTHLDRMLRSIIIKLSCLCGSQHCLDEASSLFKQWMKGTKIIPPNLRIRVYEFGVKQHGYLAWDYMWKRYLTESSAQEKSKLLFGLSKTRILWVLHRYLRLSEDENNVKRQDYFTVLYYLSLTPNGRTAAWLYLRQNWQQLVKRFTLSDRYLGRTVKSIVQGFKSPVHLREVKNFFKEYPEAGAGRRNREQALESIEGRIRWLKINEPVVTSWLKSTVQNL